MPGLFNSRSTRQTGKKGEDDALLYLLQAGLKFVDRNFRCKMGEIDLIMDDSGTLVFVEVRKRSRSHFGSALESITRAKRIRLTRTAGFYLQTIKKEPPCRFDVVAIDDGTIVWVRNIIEVV